MAHCKQENIIILCIIAGVFHTTGNAVTGVAGPVGKHGNAGCVIAMRIV